MQRFPEVGSDPDLSRRFLECLLRHFTRDLASLVKTEGLAEEVLHFAMSPPTPGRKRPPQRVDLPEGFLQRLGYWYEVVAGDRFFSPECLLQLGVHLASLDRYGTEALDIEPYALDFTAAYLRFFLEDLMDQPTPLYGPRIAWLVRGWSRRELEEAGIPQPLIEGLELAGRLEQLLQQGLTSPQWSAFVDSLPVFHRWGSQRMQTYLGEVPELGEQLIQLWQQTTAPGADLAEHALDVVRGKLSPERFQRYLEIGAPRSRTHLNWEVLPPGYWRDPAVAQQLRASCGSDAEWRLRFDRLEFLDSLGPLRLYRGRLGERRNYEVFEFTHHAVAESEEFGNALYLVDKRQLDWQQVLALTKRQALQSGARRLIHDDQGRWRSRLAGVLGVALPPLKGPSLEPVPVPTGRRRSIGHSERGPARDEEHKPGLAAARFALEATKARLRLYTKPENRSRNLQNLLNHLDKVMALWPESRACFEKIRRQQEEAAQVLSRFQFRI